MKKVLAVILSVIMMFSVLPVCFAESTKTENVGSTIWDATVDAVKPIIDAVKSIIDFFKSIFNQIKSFFEEISFKIDMSQRSDTPKKLEYTEYQNNKLSEFAEENKTALHGQTVLVGDSITDIFPHEECFTEYTALTGQKVYNRGISGDVTTNLLERLDENVLSLEPKNIVLLIGTNDIAYDASPKGIANNIQKILDLIKKELGDNVNVILETVYPTSNVKSVNWDARSGRPNRVIDLVNVEIKALSEKNNVTLLDLTSKLSDKNGEFNKDYTYDGLHPNEKAYKEIIAPAIIPLLK